jgi:hypothetical protein
MSKPLLLDVEPELIADVQRALGNFGLTIRAETRHGRTRHTIEIIPVYLRGARAETAPRTGTETK